MGEGWSFIYFGCIFGILDLLYYSIAHHCVASRSARIQLADNRGAEFEFVYLFAFSTKSMSSHSHSHDAEGNRISADNQLATIHATFDRYLPHALSVNNRRRKDFFSLEKRYQDLLPGYATSSFSGRNDGKEREGEGGLLREVDNAIRVNAVFVREMLQGSGADFLTPTYQENVEEKEEGEGGGIDGAEAPNEMDFGKLESTLRQCVRDWSAEVSLSSRVIVPGRSMARDDRV